MSSVRWCGTADVANPRPREVGGACRRQVLAGARTQETVGGPNGAQRSELRRTAPPDDKRYHDCQMLPWYVIDFRHLPRLYDIDNPQSHLTWQRRYFIFSCARIDAHLIPVLFFAKILLNLQTVLKPDVCRNIILLKSAGRKT